MLPIRVEEWSPGERGAVLAALCALEPALLSGWVVGSYVFGRTDDNPPKDLDLVVLVSEETFEKRLASYRAVGFQPDPRYVDEKGRPFFFMLWANDRRDIARELGVPVDVWWRIDPPEHAPSFCISCGKLYNKQPGESVPGTWRNVDGRWVPARRKPPPKRYTFV